jgi:hypothetical protein
MKILPRLVGLMICAFMVNGTKSVFLVEVVAP